ncbi:protein-L-isoaspartate(D-aspartate) O-methyltransferase [Candidatus Omnitrophota bacterium]
MNYPVLRDKMVAEQLRPRGITDIHALQAFQKVPRHNFVPDQQLSSAYSDQPLPIGAGQTISQPYMVALMTQCLELTKRQTVLEIGTGSGYQAAILAELAKQVYTIERLANLSEQARLSLQKLGYQNVQTRTTDGIGGWPEFAPYDKIMVTAAASAIPEALLAQLKPGGKLIIPLNSGLHQILTLITKFKTTIETEQICDCVFVPLITGGDQKVR